MATYRIFITEEEAKYQKLGKRAEFTYAHGMLTIYNDNKVFCRIAAENGDAYVLRCQNNTATLHKMEPPYKKGNLVAWLMGFTKHNRTQNKEEYEELLEIRRNRYLYDGYREWQHVGNSYIITQCSRTDKINGYHNVAAYVGENITRAEVLELVRKGLFVFPDFYVKKMFKESFGITEYMFDMAKYYDEPL